MKTYEKIITPPTARVSSKIYHRSFFSHITYFDRYIMASSGATIRAWKPVYYHVWNKRFILRNLLEALPWIILAVLATSFLFNKAYGPYPNPAKARLSSSVQIRTSFPASDHIVHPDYKVLVRIGKRFLNLGLNEDAMIQFLKAEKLNPRGKNAKIGLAISLNRLCIKEGKYCTFSERHSHFFLDNRLINKKDFCWWSVP